MNESSRLRPAVERAVITPSVVTEHLPAGDALASFGTILRLAGPLVLSMSALMVMVLLNRLFLSWYSQESIAAIGPAGMTSYLVMSLFIGAASFTSTLVAQYVGSRQSARVGPAVWQGIYFSLIAGAIVASMSWLAEPIFRWVGHPLEVQRCEVEYFRITCLGAPLVVLGAALGSFFTGRGNTRPLALVLLCGFALNVGLDYVLIFGKFGYPELGITGAALATVISYGFITVVLLALFLLPRHGRGLATWHMRPQPQLMERLARFGLPIGGRFALGLLALNLFMIFVGRLGEMEGAATNIALAINSFAFFPVVGISEAIRVLVGHAQGQGRPALAVRCTWRGLLLSEMWVLAMAGFYLFSPAHIIQIFHDAKRMTPEQFEQLSGLCVELLRFVALYCVVDAVNISLLGALQGAGDTHWTLAISLIVHLMFFTALMVLDLFKFGLTAEWIAATTFVVLQSFVWLARFLSGRWKALKIIETVPQQAPAA
jgi:MATE family multidrug resistance protein